MRRLVRLGLVMLALGGGGCPRTFGVGEAPADVTRCTRTEDCNTQSCGRLRACVAGLCEAPDAGTLTIPCEDGGTP